MGIIRVLPGVVAVAVGVTPPAVIPPPVQPVVVPSTAVASQLRGSATGLASAPMPSGSVTAPQFFSDRAPLLVTETMALPLGSTGLQQEGILQQPPQANVWSTMESKTGTAPVSPHTMLATFLLAAVAAAAGGQLWLRRRAPAATKRAAATEMTGRDAKLIADSSIALASAQPKYAMAAFTSETAAEAPAGSWDPLSLGNPETKSFEVTFKGLRERVHKEISHGRALLETVVGHSLSAGAMLGLAIGLFAAQPAQAITKEQFDQLTYQQVKGSGLANRCPTVESNGTSIPVQAGQKLRYVCFEPKSFAVETETEKGKEFVTTKLMTRQTYSLAFIEGPLTPNPITFKVEDGLDHAATTVQLPDGERVPFLFTVKGGVFKGQGSEFKPGFTWGGEFDVPSYRTGGFLDPKGRGMYTGYDQAVALPALQADGKAGQDELFKESNKVFDVGRGAIEMEVNKVNAELGEIGGVFVSKQPGDTDMGAKAPKTILLKGIFFGKVES